MKDRSLIPRIVCALLLLSLAAATLPRLLVFAHDAWTMLPLSCEARRERQMGSWYSSIQSLRRTLPKKEPVALIAARRVSDAGIFANYYLYPIRTRLFASRDDFRNAANDADRPKTIVAVTAERAERDTYEVLRDRELRAGRRVVTSPQLSEPATSFVLPIAASLDGAAPETYVIEATLADQNGSTAHNPLMERLPLTNEVRVTFWPKGQTTILRIGDGETVLYYDLVYQLFGVMESGWVRIESTLPLRAAFYFVNRGHADATRLPDVQRAATRIASEPLHRDSKLYLLNFGDAIAPTTVGAEMIPITPHAIVSKPITSIPPVSGNVFAFVTTRELNGKTDFLWPEP
ncbi:MAG: hypothetical protein QOC81_2316 [Thermoanaerobaculia bacterium]|jgi:hypothetical protein|nr:hypothetical protein [Thermoanaerobaculia bacterium]